MIHIVAWNSYLVSNNDWHSYLGRDYCYTDDQQAIHSGSPEWLLGAGTRRLLIIIEPTEIIISRLSTLSCPEKLLGAGTRRLLCISGAY